MVGETVTHVRLVQDGVDEVNMPVFREEMTDVDNVFVAPLKPSVNPDTGKIVVEDGFTLYLRPEYVSHERDEWIIRGDRYKSVGGSLRWGPGFSGWVPGSVVNVTRGRFSDGKT